MTVTQADAGTLREELAARVAAGDRFAGLFGTRSEGAPLVLSALVATANNIDTLEAPLPPGAASYPALTPRLGAAFWYERVIHDRFGVVPDGLLLFDRLTGREHLVVVGRLYGLGRTESARRADELLATMELAGEARKLIADYSFGMRKKLALASALIHGPELLFLDEPFEGVDAVAKASLTALLSDLVRRGRLTVFLTSHVLEVVERLCDNVGVIHRGRLVAQGTLSGVVQAVPGAASLTDAFVRLVGEGRGGTRALSFLP